MKHGFLILDGNEINGELDMTGSLNLLRFLIDAGDSFLPFTHDTVAIEANPNFLLRPEAVLVNTQRIHFIGEVEPIVPTESMQQHSVGE